MKKVIISAILLLLVLSPILAQAEAAGTNVSVDGISIKELSGVTFTVVVREVKKEDEGPLKIDGKLIAKGPVTILDRILGSESKVDINIVNVRNENESEELTLKDCNIDSVSKGSKQYIYRFTAEAVE